MSHTLPAYYHASSKTFNLLQVTRLAYQTTRLGFLSKDSIIQALTNANYYKNPIKHIAIRYFVGSHHISSQSDPTRPQTPYLNKYAHTHYENVADQITEFKRDSDHIISACHFPKLTKHIKSLLHCQDSLKIENNPNRITSANMCNKRLCPYCAVRKANRIMYRLNRGFEHLDFQIRHVWRLTVSTEEIPAKDALMSERTDDFNNMISKVFTSYNRKMVESSTSSKKASIIGTHSSLEIIPSTRTDYAFPHINITILFNQKLAKNWIKEEVLIDLIKKYLPSATNFHITRSGHSSNDDAVLQALHSIQYSLKPFGVKLPSTFTGELDDYQKENLDIPLHLRPTNSAIRDIPLKFLRQYFRGIEGKQLHRFTGILAKVKAKGTEIHLAQAKEKREQAQKENSGKQRMPCTSSHATWSPNTFKDNTNHIHQVGELVLTEHSALWLMSDIFNTPPPPPPYVKELDEFAQCNTPQQPKEASDPFVNNRIKTCAMDMAVNQVQFKVDQFDKPHIEHQEEQHKNSTTAPTFPIELKRPPKPTTTKLFGEQLPLLFSSHQYPPHNTQVLNKTDQKRIGSITGSTTKRKKVGADHGSI